MAQTDLPPVPYKTPMLDQNGYTTQPWMTWFRQLFDRVGRNVGYSNKGDILASNSSGIPIPISVGADGQTLVADSTKVAGVKWGSAANPMTTLGDIIYGASAGVQTRLPGDTSNVRKFLRELSAAGVAAAPAWDTIAAGDISGLSGSNFANQNAGTYLGGPYSGAASAAAFRAFQAPTIQKFTSTGTTTGYLFTVSGVTTAPTAGATYTNNGNTYTVSATNTGKTLIWATQAAAPLASGTLTKTAGTGDATISFSANVALATYTTAPGTLYIKVRAVGGGGGGSGSGTGSPGAGGTGGTTTFGSALLVVTGGIGGATSGYGGVGGTASLGSAVGTALAGGSGGGLGGSTTTGTMGGLGAASPFGGAGGSGYAGGAVGKDGSSNTGSGGGGAGVSSTGSNSGTGGGASGYIDALISAPSATYLYNIGAAGLSGTLGTNGQAGGAGASGYIEVTEHYQ